MLYYQIVKNINNVKNLTKDLTKLLNETNTLLYFIEQFS